MDLNDFKIFEGKKMVGHDGTLCQIKSADSEHITIYYPSTGLPRTEFIYKWQLKATCTFTTTFKSGDEIIDSHTIDDSKYDEMVELYNNLSNGKEIDDFGVEYDMDSIYPIEFIRDLEELDKMAEEYLKGDIVSFKIIKREGEPDGGKKTMIFDEVIRCPLCESEAELIDVVDEHHTEVYRCKVFDDHIFYKNKEKEAKKL